MIPLTDRQTLTDVPVNKIRCNLLMFSGNPNCRKKKQFLLQTDVGFRIVQALTVC